MTGQGRRGLGGASQTSSAPQTSWCHFAPSPWLPIARHVFQWSVRDRRFLPFVHQRPPLSPRDRSGPPGTPASRQLYPSLPRVFPLAIPNSPSQPPSPPHFSVPLRGPGPSHHPQLFFRCLSERSRVSRLCVFPFDPHFPSLVPPILHFTFPISNSLLLPADCGSCTSGFHLLAAPHPVLPSSSPQSLPAPSLPPPIFCPPPAPTDDLEAGDRVRVTLPCDHVTGSCRPLAVGKGGHGAQGSVGFLKKWIIKQMPSLPLNHFWIFPSPAPTHPTGC